LYQSSAGRSVERWRPAAATGRRPPNGSGSAASGSSTRSASTTWIRDGSPPARYSLQRGSADPLERSPAMNGFVLGLLSLALLAAPERPDRVIADFEHD